MADLIVNEFHENDAFVADSFTREELDRAAVEYDEHKQRIDIAPATSQLLGPFTIVCLVLNRTIGSGIFTIPPKILAGAGSVGGAILIWTFSGLIVICGTLCWLELGLSIPFHKVEAENGEVREVSAPRSGGEKNFIEYIFDKPKMLITCMYGIMFVVLGNISGNAVAFGIYVAIAAGNDPLSIDPGKQEKGLVNGLAIITLTICAAIHIFSRRGGVLLNNFFAVIKVAMVLGLTILGFIHAAGTHQRSTFSELVYESPSNDSCQSSQNFNITDQDINNAKNNFNDAFGGGRGDVASYSGSFLYALFAYTGFEQPFYVLSEVQRPRKTFPRYVLTGVVLTTILYVLIDISYFCVVPHVVYTTCPSNSLNMAGAFLHYLFDQSSGPRTADRVMAALIAISIFGNVIVMTFTAARVKQEIAKEGILPYSLFFATGRTTPLAWLKNRFTSDPSIRRDYVAGAINLDNHLEKSPMAALGLHWISSVVLVLVTVPLAPATQYSFLTSLYSYVNLTIVGFLVSTGLLYLKLDSFFRGGTKGRKWNSKVQYLPWLSPVHVVVFFCATSFFLCASFVPPMEDSTFSFNIIGYPWYIVPTIGISSLLWGVVWWFGIKGLEWQRWRKLIVTRTPYVVQDQDGHYVQKAELVEHEWQTARTHDY